MRRRRKTQAEPSPKLLEAAARGDERSFASIVRLYEQVVYSFAFKLCRDRQKAAETLQDTFVNLYRKLSQFDGKSKFTTWLYTIVVNNCLMKHRKRKLEELSVPIDELTPEHGAREGEVIQPWKTTSPLERVMTGELRDLLDRAIGKLPPVYRVVFVLRDVEGLSAEETARSLAISVPAVKSRLRRARIFLRDELDPYMRS